MTNGRETAVADLVIRGGTVVSPDAQFAASERVHYPDVDLRMERDGSGRRFVTRAGEVIRD